MARVKGGKVANRRRKKLLGQVKGYRFGRSKKKKQATEAMHHAYEYAFAHRRDKKKDFRRLWTARLNAGLKNAGLKYNVFMKTLRDKNVKINKKMLATLAAEKPDTFERLLNQIK
jgi:large subunit ribosomal protein L20